MHGVKGLSSWEFFIYLVGVIALVDWAMRKVVWPLCRKFERWVKR